MSPLIVPILVVIAISIALGSMSLRLALRSRTAACTLAGTAVAGLLLNALAFQDSVSLARVLPLRDVVILGNLMLPLSAVLAASAFPLLQSASWQKWLLTLALLSVALWRFFAPLLQPAPVLTESRWTNGVCRQSSLSSCSAAAAATVLRDVGIATEEREMAFHCLTTVDGTTTLGLYRGLKLKTGGTAFHVIPLRDTADSLRQRNVRRCVFSILGGQRHFLEQRGSHSVVLFRFNPDHSAEIGDPFTGRQTWSKKQFDQLWPGAGLCVAERSLN